MFKNGTFNRKASLVSTPPPVEVSIDVHMAQRRRGDATAILCGGNERGSEQSHVEPSHVSPRSGRASGVDRVTRKPSKRFSRPEQELRRLLQLHEELHTAAPVHAAAHP